MKILVTGATGFIGSHVVRTLTQRGADVVAVVRPGRPGRRLDDTLPRLSLVEADLEDPAATASAVTRAAPDAAIHLAWYVEPGRYLHAARENLASLEASVRLLRCLLDGGCDRIVVAGTCFEPGAGTGVRPAQHSIYASAKAALHEVVLGLAAEGAAASCAHVFYVYGPHEDERRLVPTLVRALLAGRAVEVTDGRQRRDYLHVADVASALATLVEAGISGPVDVCRGTPTLLAELFAALGEATGRGDLLRVGARPYAEGEVLEATGDDRVLRSLGWSPSFDLRSGVQDTVAWWEKEGLR